MSVQIDEPWCGDELIGVNDALSLLVHLAQLDDATISDPDVRAPASSSRAVDEVRATYHQVQHCFPLSTSAALSESEGGGCYRGRSRCSGTSTRREWIEWKLVARVGTVAGAL